MALAAYEYQFTPSSGSTVTISHNTSFTEGQPGARLALWTFHGLDGEAGLKSGKTGRRGVLDAWFHDSSESAVRTSMAALDLLAANATVCSVAIRGGAATWANTIIEDVQYLEHYTDPLGYYGQHLRIVLRQLVPDI